MNQNNQCFPLLDNIRTKANRIENRFSQFTRITSIEQRRQYKTEFDHDYAEYMRLHGDTERVSKRFVQLEESLRSEENNDQRYKVRSRTASVRISNLSNNCSLTFL